MENNDFMQLLVEPGYRQAVVVGVGAMIGALKPLFELAYYKIRPIKGRKHITGPSEEWTKNARARSRELDGILCADAAVLGVEEAVRNSSYLLDSGVVEVSADVASSVAGYFAGKYIRERLCNILLKDDKKERKRITDL